MARTPKRLSGPSALTTSAVTQYTVPSTTKTILRHIHASNPSGGAVTFTLSIGADATGTRVYDAISIASGGVLDAFCYYVLEAATVVQAFASSTAIVLTLDGDELTLG